MAPTIVSTKNAPANAEMMIAHNIDEDSTPPPVPPGPPPIVDDIGGYLRTRRGWKAPKLTQEEGKTREEPA